MEKRQKSDGDQLMSKANPSTPDILKQALRKAEMQNLQLQMEMRFKHNMEAFKTVARTIYDQFIDYQAEELRISYDTNDNLNLVNYKLNNKPVYAKNPVEFCEEQFNAFRQVPTMSVIRFGKSKIVNEDFKHPVLVNKLIEDIESRNIARHYSTDGPIGCLLLTGCGLGYHIESIVKHLDIRNLCIFDPHKDSFYASLHIIDWVPILKKLTQKGRMLKLLIGVEPKDAMADMKLMSDKIGLFNLVHTYIYRHFSSAKEDAFIELYRKEFHLNASGTGFFDDEQVSFTHTIKNINNKLNFFRYPKEKKTHPTAFVIGNGPSLDEHIEYIREHQQNAIIFSCGTSIASLYKSGIKPDFQIEIERNTNTADWIIHGTPEEFRKDLTLLGLNTLAPEVTPLFEDSCLAVKPNDVGQHVIEKELPNKGLHPLILCNPTVTNGGLSYALTMGFEEIYLFGVDLGVREDGAHHSSLSLYYDLEKKTKQKGYSGFERKEGDYEISGNFGDKVTTNPVLHSTKTNMEILMRHFSRSGYTFNVYNPNRGAFIDGAKPIEQKDLPSPKPLANKAQLVSEIKETYFYTPDIEELTESKIRKHFLKHFFDMRKKITLRKDIHDFKTLHQEMNRIYKVILEAKKEAPVSCLLMRGSINSFFTLMCHAVCYLKNPEEFDELYTMARSYYMEMLESAYHLMETDPLRADTTQDKVARKLSEPEQK